MGMGEFQKRVEAEIDRDNYIGWKEQEAFDAMKEKVLEIVEDAKKALIPPSIIDYPCEHWEARKLYEDAIREFRKQFVRWFGGAENK